MIKLLKKIWTIFRLLFNFIVRRKHYHLTFVKELYEDYIPVWYYDFKWWGFEKGNLSMVSGADTLCEKYSNGTNKAVVDIIASKKPIKGDTVNDYVEYKGEDYEVKGKWYDKYLWGRTYVTTYTGDDGKTHIETFWICPVTLFVLGRYPNYIYLKKIENND